MMIKCIEYDYIEIVCLYRYPIKVTLKNARVIEGKALDTVRNSDREECIKVNNEDNEQMIVLDEIATLEVCIANPHFQIIDFT